VWERSSKSTVLLVAGTVVALSACGTRLPESVQAQLQSGQDQPGEVALPDDPTGAAGAASSPDTPPNSSEGSTSSPGVPNPVGSIGQTDGPATTDPSTTGTSGTPTSAGGSTSAPARRTAI
jgi:hypothetical protein